MYKLSLIIVLISTAFAAEITNQIVNKNVERTIDLTTQLVKITTTITLENTGKDAVRNYVVALEEPVAGNLSFIQVHDAKKESLKLVPTKLGQKEGLSVELKQPLGPGRAQQLTVESVYTKALQPYPSHITQKEKQLVRYFGNHYFYSPYLTQKQTTSVTLSSRSVESYSKLKPVAQTDSSITYGPYSDVPAFSSDRLMVHYENNAPFLTVSRMERLIEVSHWGNIAVEENIEIVHTGAKLKGPFSRYDYQRDTGSSHHSIKSYKTILPASAHSIYYRDSNGNISTSQVKYRKDWIELELRPRFPLFGGWKSSYTLGYSVPSYQYLLKRPNNQYVLNMRLIDHVFDDMHVEELETSVVLPVGVTDVNVKAPYEVERLPDDVTYKYLDNLGRKVVRLRKRNLVEQHIQDFEITYNWSSLLLLHEPLMLAVSLYVLFVVVIAYVRLDFSIHKPEHSKKE